MISNEVRRGVFVQRDYGPDSRQTIMVRGASVPPTESSMWLDVISLKHFRFDEIFQDKDQATDMLRTVLNEALKRLGP
jgi:hypothetical protein